MQNGSVFFNTWVSVPDILRAAVPRIIFAGATALFNPLESECNAMIRILFIPRWDAICDCKSPNKMFELWLLPVMNTPSIPMKGLTIGKRGPVNGAICKVIIFNAPESRKIIDKVNRNDNVIKGVINSEKDWLMSFLIFGKSSADFIL